MASPRLGAVAMNFSNSILALPSLIRQNLLARKRIIFDREADPTMFKLSGFGDEIAEDFETQLRELRAMGINHIALRNLWGTNILKLDKKQKAKAKGLLRALGMGVSEIGSPVAKSLVTDSWDEEQERYERAIEMSKYFICPRIRIFSYLIPKGDPPEKHRREVLRRMKALAARAEKEGIILLHENDEGMYGADGVHTLDLLRSVDSPNLKLAFDPSNFVSISTRPYTQWWEMLAEHVVHFHVKDQKLPRIAGADDLKRHESYSNREQTPAGEGDGEFMPIVRSLKERGYVGFATMEPHLAKAGQFAGFSGPKLFAHATDTFRALCDKAGMPCRQVRMGVIGAGGFIGGFHCKAMQDAAQAHLVAACDAVDSPKLREAGETFNIEVYSTVAEMLKRKDIDAVTIGAPSGLHGPLAILAMNAGKHVLTEKPIEITLKKADAMIAAAKKKKVTLGVISQHRTDPGMIELREAIRSGAIGKVVLAEAYVKWHRTQEYYDSGGWRGTWKLDGGGALMNQGVHTVDMLQWAMDSPVESVVAQTARATHARIEVEDVAQALLKFKNGALGMIVASTSVYPGFPERLEVTGTKGTIIVEKDRVTVREIAGEKKSEKTGAAGDYLVGASDPKAISNRGHVLQIDDFCAAIVEGRDPLVPGAEGRKPLEIILAIYESARTDKRVKLPIR